MLRALTGAERWASCGAMALTGDRFGRPLAPPTDAADRVDEWLEPFGWDARVLGERAALHGLDRAGRVSCGGSSRLLRATDDWVALSVARPEDAEMMPALLAVPTNTFPVRTGTEEWWAVVASLLGGRSAGELLERSSLLGVPLSAANERVSACSVSGAERSRPLPIAASPVVVDLSGLWAGPLAASALASVGAQVIKVESGSRPDGARRGSAKFFDLLNAAKRSVVFDLEEETGRAQLARLVEAADIVITSSRARAIEQLGLDPPSFLAAGSDRVWVAITAHGWESDRVGFGDDCGAAGGLLAWHPEDGAPRFAADAIADPLCGAWAAWSAWRAWMGGGRRFIDASLAGVAAMVDGPGRVTARAARPSVAPGGEPAWSLDGVHVRGPFARRSRRVAPPLGADTDSVWAGLA